MGSNSLKILVFLSIVLNVQSDTLLTTVEGFVEKENFTYYRVNYEGNLLLSLRSIDGDADLYVSNRQTPPSFEADTYDVHSSTCGIDSVVISKSYKRPLIVGIYGYPSQDIVQFVMEIYETEQEVLFHYGDSVEEDENLNEATAKSMVEPQDKTVVKTPVRGSDSRKRVKKLVGKTGVWAVLEILELLFL